MEVSAETADLVVREGVQLSEEAIKLLASGAKNLAALLYALAKDQKKLYGKVSMNRLLQEGRPLQIFPLRAADLDEFKKRAKKVGLLFTVVQDKSSGSTCLDVITNVDHLAQANYILQQMGYLPQNREDKTPKKEQPPAQPGRFSPERSSGLTQGTDSINNKNKPSVKGRLAALRAAAGKAEPQRELEHIR